MTSVDKKCIQAALKSLKRIHFTASQSVCNAIACLETVLETTELKYFKVDFYFNNESVDENDELVAEVFVHAKDKTSARRIAISKVDVQWDYNEVGEVELVEV